MAGEVASVARWGREFVRPYLTTAVHSRMPCTHSPSPTRAASAKRSPSPGKDVISASVTRPDRRCSGGQRPRHSGSRGDPGDPRRGRGVSRRSGVPLPDPAARRCAPGWAQQELDREPQTFDAEGWAFARAAAFESQGLAALSDKRYAAAADLFEHAAELAADAPRFALRTRWAHAEALRRSGDLRRATSLLETLESETARLRLKALKGRIQATLRAVGGSPTSPPTPTDTLTPRQAQVLGLVAEGLTTAEIAVALGLRPGTVDRHIAEAMRRLSATTRWQAARLAVEPDDVALP